jgi:hypothetical protein
MGIGYGGKEYIVWVLKSVSRHEDFTLHAVVFCARFFVSWGFEVKLCGITYVKVSILVWADGMRRHMQGRLDCSV